MILGLLAFIAFVVILWYFVSQKLLTDAEEQVVIAWTALDSIHQQRENLAREILQSTLEDHDSMHELGNSWQALMKVNVNPAELNVSVLRRYREGQARLEQTMHAILEDTDYQGKDLKNMFLKKYREIQQQIPSAVHNYNSQVRAYNQLKNRFPLRLLAFSEKPLYQTEAERVDH